MQAQQNSSKAYDIQIRPIIGYTHNLNPGMMKLHIALKKSIFFCLNLIFLFNIILINRDTLIVAIFQIFDFIAA